MHRLAFATIFVSASAFAQTTPPALPDTGFFRPTPSGDMSLTHPSVVPPAATSPSIAPQPAAPVIVPVEVPVVNGATENALTRTAARTAAEIELNRAEREAAEAQARARAAPAPIPGSFTGLTSERDR